MKFPILGMNKSQPAAAKPDQYNISNAGVNVFYNVNNTVYDYDH